MSPVIQDDLKQIEQKLTVIEQKIGSKWTLPIVVAVISGLLGMATVTIQVKLEGDRTERAKVQDTRRAAEDEARKQGVAYYEKMQAAALEVRKTLREQCTRSETTEDKLNIALETFWDLAEVNRARYGDEFTNNVQVYGEWIAESGYDSGRINCEESEAKFRIFTKALTDFYNSRCTVPKDPKEDEQKQYVGSL
jgi:hypothetical protein